MTGVMTSLQQLKDGSLHALSSSFARWTKPLTSSLPLSTLADLSQSKSELVAENALLRQQLIILRRQVKRPACTKTDRVLLVLLARWVRTWQQTHITRATRHPSPVASGALPLGLEAQVKSRFSQAKARPGDHRLDQRDGEEQSPSSALKGFGGNY